jgi:3-deoxy-D-manno-octulosonic-acid transferase
MVATRPIWLAATIKLTALESILAAHTQATRRAHRLLLIVVPFDNSETERFQKILTEKGFLFATRSKGEEPEVGVQVYLADTEEELGLWFRLAPVSFLSQSNISVDQDTPDPLEAAALGSVVLHGPEICAHQISYQRLARAGASRIVAHMGELAHALEAVLAPDRAAVMAHAGWQITSSGAEAMDAARQTIGKYLGTEPEVEK